MSASQLEIFESHFDYVRFTRTDGHYAKYDSFLSGNTFSGVVDIYNKVIPGAFHIGYYIDKPIVENFQNELKLFANEGCINIGSESAPEKSTIKVKKGFFYNCPNSSSQTLNVFGKPKGIHDDRSDTGGLILNESAQISGNNVANVFIMGMITSQSDHGNVFGAIANLSLNGSTLGGNVLFQSVRKLRVESSVFKDRTTISSFANNFSFVNCIFKGETVKVHLIPHLRFTIIPHLFS